MQKSFTQKKEYTTNQLFRASNFMQAQCATETKNMMCECVQIMDSGVSNE